MTAPEFPSLRDFLLAPTRPAGTFTYHAVQGFLFAIACSPEMVEPSEWLPVIFNDKPAGFASEEEAQQILGELMALYNSVNTSLPEDCPVRPDPMANFDHDAPLAGWSRGFLAGHDWLDESWDVELEQEMEDELGAILLALTLFSSRDVAERFQREGDFGPDSLETVAARAIELIPDAMASYAHMGRIVLAELYAPVEQRVVTKVGRNEPCPCGSGKKFKQCHGST